MPRVILDRAADVRPRLLVVVVLMALAVALVAARVVYLQTMGGDTRKEAGRDQRTTSMRLVAKRGTIFARDGGELVLSVPSSTIFADPRLVEDPAGVVATLTAVLGLSPERQQTLTEAFAAKDKSFVYVARQIDDALAASVMALRLSGIDVLAEEKRIMPSGEVGRSVLGRTDIDGNGIAGLEEQFDDVLRGTDGSVVRERDREGRSIAGAGATTIEPVPGVDLILTIDRSLQFQIERALLARVDELRARGGNVVVLDTATGDIIAMANVVRRDDGVAEVSSANLSVVEAFEPGSVAKVFSLAAVVDSGAADPDARVEVPGSMVFNKGTKWEQTIRDAEPHPLQWMSLREVITKSSNIGTLQFAARVTNARMEEYLRAFGFGVKTPLQFPDETAGAVKAADRWQGAEPATISYGYGYTASSLQLAAAVNAVANGGVYVAPRLLAGTIDADGGIVEAPTSPTRRVMRPESAAVLVDMLRSVVCNGTGRDARMGMMSVAGKTGTAYKVQDAAGYGEDGSRLYRASFVGFFPALAPRVTVLVTIDEPDPTSSDRFGGKAAAPLFARIAASAIHELAITPTPGDQGCAGR